MTSFCTPTERADDDMTAELIATCGTCKEPVTGDQGSLWIVPADAYDHANVVAGWDEKRTAALANAETDSEAFAAKQKWWNMPDLPEWRVDHYACKPLTNSGAYSIEVSRVDTWQKLCWWAGQLGGKSWIAATDWPMLIQGAADGTDVRLSPVTSQTAGAV
jgi:hypothetical protein